MPPSLSGLLGPLRARVDREVGGERRRQVIVTFAAVLALDSADRATVGTNAVQLQDALGIGRPEIGLLLAVSSLVGALAVVPAGILVDRVRRSPLLARAILLWGVAMLLSAIATDYTFLLYTRLLLGALVAVAGPAIASMVGDYFPEADRGRVYGYILSGELLGAGLGFMVSGQLALLSWRAPFAALVVPTALVWWLVHRLPEPARDGSDRLPDGEVSAKADDDAGVDAAEVVADHGVTPTDDATAAPSTEDDRRLSLPKAVVRVLSVRTNRILVIASALGYFFFSGVRGFAVEFAQRQYGIGQSLASTLVLLLGIGALVGVLWGGRIADSLMRRGRLAARVEVPGVAVLVSAVLFVPAFLTGNVIVAAVLLGLAAMFLGAANPPLDAARLDIMPPALWGRAEAVRSLLRDVGDASAPLLFGVASSGVFSEETGLRDTFLISLLALCAAGTVALAIARRTYPEDVATAAHQPSGE
ncbi:MAG TPA: MFS transporter [Nocardioides sp.]|uniref:MFS transporter n=1 Tax=Nocardioides sp. TaxID=35761 RepID=UPI002F41FFF5